MKRTLTADIKKGEKKMMTYDLKVSFDDVRKAYAKNHKAGNLRDIRAAYEYAARKHAGVPRKSGEPYINHPLRVARLLAEWGFESDVLIAAFLHDVVEDCDTPLSEIEQYFGSVVARTVDAVTALSDRDFTDHSLTKAQRDMLSDVRLQRKMNEKALVVKIADRIDNLQTIFAVEEEKRIPKAEHTREILIPMAEQANAYYFVDELEELCFQIEQPARYEDIQRRCRAIRSANSRKCNESLDTLSTIFDPAHNYAQDEMEPYHTHIRRFMHAHRSAVSIYRQITRQADNYRTAVESQLRKENFALYDIFLIVSDDLGVQGAAVTPKGLFFQYFDQVLSKKGFYLLRYQRTTHNDAGYFVIADEMDNLYRFFVRTEKEYIRYLYGNIIDESSSLSFPNVDEVDPRETYSEKIKVFRRDGSSMIIDKNASVLDFAFYIHTDLGLHFHHALVNDTRTCLPPHTRLNSGDKIVIVSDSQVCPSLTWFRYTRTARATDQLVRYFIQLYEKND